MKRAQKILAGILTACMLLAPSAAAAGLTRGETAQKLLAAADDYNPGVQMSDILLGYGKGDLQEERAVTRVQALVMLDRAFGGLPVPTGDNARLAAPSGNYTDLPTWSRKELDAVLGAGIVAGKSETELGANDEVTAEELDKLIRRVYSLEGSNLKDDFYAAINKDYLENGTIPPGLSKYNPINAIANDETTLPAVIKRAASGTNEKGTPAQRVGDLYNTILDWDHRNADGIAPVKPYLELIDGAGTTAELLEVEDRLTRELGLRGSRNFALSEDPMGGSTKLLAYAPTDILLLDKQIYEQDEIPEKAACVDYVTALLTLAGYPADDAARQAGLFWASNKAVAADMLTAEEAVDPEHVYNIFSFDELKGLYPNARLDEAIQLLGLTPAAEIMNEDVGKTKALSRFYEPDQLETLRVRIRVNLLSTLGVTLNRGFQEAENAYQNALKGASGSKTDEQLACDAVKEALITDLDHLYAEQCFSPEAKADVTDMVRDFLEVYAGRIRRLDWMGEETKAQAIGKLENMRIMVGYPDEGKWETALEGDIKGVAEGGTYFSNMTEIMRRKIVKAAEGQGKPMNKDIWPESEMGVFTANAAYFPTYNAIVFPAGILRAPLYDVNNTREQNLGGVGWVIAHEISHAFDTQGGNFDKNGDYLDWWTEEDRAAYKARYQKLIDLFDASEVANGIAVNGRLTIGENIADLGAMACVTEAAKRTGSADLRQLYEAAAHTWQCLSSREYWRGNTLVNPHAPDKLRVNNVLSQLDEFQEAFDIRPGDGMYVAPEDRIRIW